MQRLNMDPKRRARLALLMKALSLGFPLAVPREGKNHMAHIGMDEEGEVWFLALAYKDGDSHLTPIEPFRFIGEPVTVGFVADLAGLMTDDEAVVLAAEVGLTEMQAEKSRRTP